MTNFLSRIETANSNIRTHPTITQQAKAALLKITSFLHTTISQTNKADGVNGPSFDTSLPLASERLLTLLERRVGPRCAPSSDELKSLLDEGKSFEDMVTRGFQDNLLRQLKALTMKIEDVFLRESTILAIEYVQEILGPVKLSKRSMIIAEVRTLVKDILNLVHDAGDVGGVPLQKVVDRRTQKLCEVVLEFLSTPRWS